MSIPILSTPWPLKLCVSVRNLGSLHAEVFYVHSQPQLASSLARTSTTGIRIRLETQTNLRHRIIRDV